MVKKTKMLTNFIILAAEKAIYPLIFLFLLIEGPTTNFIVSMYAGLSSNLNIFIIVVLAILGDFIGDNIYYLIGRRVSDEKLKERIEKTKIKKLFGLLERTLKKRLFVALMIIKIAPISGIGLIYVGKKRIDYRKFIVYSLILCILIDVFISFLGYSLMISLSSFLKIQSQLGEIGLLIFVFLFFGVVIYFLKNYLNERYVNKLE